MGEYEKASGFAYGAQTSPGNTKYPALWGEGYKKRI